MAEPVAFLNCVIDGYYDTIGYKRQTCHSHSSPTIKQSVRAHTTVNGRRIEGRIYMAEGGNTLVFRPFHYFMPYLAVQQ